MTPQSLRNLINLASAALRGEKVQAPPEGMAALWQDVVAGVAYLTELEKPPATGEVPKP